MTEHEARIRRIARLAAVGIVAAAKIAVDEAHGTALADDEARAFVAMCRSERAL